MQLRRKQIEILKQNSDNFYTLVHLYRQLRTVGGFKIAEAAELYDVLNKDLQTSELGTEIREIIAAARSTEMGNPVSVFSIETNSGGSFSNSSLKGAVYLLAFGATWCGPCKERMPVLNQLYDKYKSSGFQIVYVNLDEKTELWKQQIDKFQMNNWINVSEGVKWDVSEMVKRFNISAIPFYLLINKEGTIVYNPFQVNDYEYKQLSKAIIAALQ